MRGKVRWGILGTGNIAGTFAAAIGASSSGELVAVASRTMETAEAFGSRHNIPIRFGSYSQLLADESVDVVYIALPHHLHAEWSIKAARAGKAILCEKPCAINYQTAVAVLEEVRRCDVFYMEAFMYRCHRQTKSLIELLRDRTIGEVRLIECAFSYHADLNRAEMGRARARGGGGILDVGCYPISMARLIAGIETGSDAIRPIEVQGMAHVGTESGFDEWAVANLRFEGDILAQVSTGVLVEQGNSLRIFGSKGSIHVPSPWVPGGREAGSTSIFVKKTGKSEIAELKVETSSGLYVQEADTVAENIERKQAPEMSWHDTLANMETLDLWRKTVGANHVADSYDICSADRSRSR